MTLDPTKREGLSPGDRKFLEIIERHGWHVMSVAPRLNSVEKEEWWSYSTGLFHSYQHPEIVVFGLDSGTGSSVINVVGTLIKSGKRFFPGVEYADVLEGNDCVFREMDRHHYYEYLGYSRWFYEGDAFPTLQLLWPDLNGKYPWDPTCSSGVVELQPLMFKQS